MASETRAGGVGPETKLRNSCNACAAAKIKCTQEKPACAYCVKRLKACVYGVSKRVRRTPRGHASITRVGDASTTAACPNPACANPAPTAFGSTTSSVSSLGSATGTDATTCQTSAPATPLLGQDWPESLSTLIFPGITTPSTEPSLSAEWANLGTSIDSFPYLDDSTFSFPTPLDQNAPIDGNQVIDHGISNEGATVGTNNNTLDDPFTRSNGGHGNDMSTFPTGPQTGASVALPTSPGHPSSVRRSPDHRTSTAIPPVPRCQCFVRILRSLAQLAIDPSEAWTAPENGDASSQQPRFDQVQNQVEAMSDDMDKVLQCSCSKQSDMIVLLSLVIFKILAWYAAAVNAATSDDNEPDTSDSADAKPTRSRRRLVLPSSWTDVDGDESEGEDQRRIFIQHVLSRLTGLQILIGRLSQLFTNVESESWPTAPLRPTAQGPFHSVIEGKIIIIPFSNSLLCALSSDLRNRLCGVSRAIMEKLRVV